MLGVYIHIPFCVSKCNYCDFYSLGRKTAVPDEYVNAIIAQYQNFKQKGEIIASPDTIYFGGGTPSLLTAKQVDSILTEICGDNTLEITLEANPKTVTENSLRDFKQVGINRLSVGVQSANDETLKILGRGHTADDARECLCFAQKAGFTNISGDIMLSLPNYANREIDDTIALLKNGGCTHISSYLLKIEPKTQFFINRPAGLPTDDQSADFYLYAVNALAENGYFQYEISNFAQKSFESRHNLIYWDCENYLGLGAAAHSCINGKRFYYPSSMADFVNNPTTVFDGICDVNDYIMLQLRLNSGLDLQKLKERFNFVFDDNKMQFLQKCCKNGLAILKNNVLCLTPKGMLLQNSILTEIL